MQHSCMTQKTQENSMIHRITVLEKIYTLNTQAPQFHMYKWMDYPNIVFTKADVAV